MGFRSALERKIVLITGASKGIGAGIARRFAECNAELYLHGRDESALRQLQAYLLADFQTRSHIIVQDLSEPGTGKLVVSQLMQSTKQLDVLVNNAGVFDAAMLAMLRPETVKKLYQINVFSLLEVCQYASRMMMRVKAGSIINMSSIMGIQGEIGQSAYAGSKAAIIGITKALAKELAPHHIRVNAIAPGFIDTAMANSAPSDMIEKRLNSIGLRRIGTPEDVANCALYLASDMSSYVTGQVIGVDGGMIV